MNLVHELSEPRYQVNLRRVASDTQFDVAV